MPDNRSMAELFEACKYGDASACIELRGKSFGDTVDMLGSPQYQQQRERQPLSATPSVVQGLSDGGSPESLLSPEGIMGEDPLLSEPFLPLAEILGEESYLTLMQAIEEYPVVEQVAEMAMQTSDGEVTGVGGPQEDLVPARVSPGEYIFSAEAVEALGLDYLEDLHEKAKAIAGSM